MHSILLLKYVQWHFIAAPAGIARAWGTLLWFGWNYFSVGLLLRTLVAPWRRIQWERPKGFRPGALLFVFASNLLSRLIGAFIRSFLIVAGLAVELYFFLAGILALLLWFALIPLMALAFFYGITLLL